MTAPKWWDCTLSREEAFRNGTPNPWSALSTDDLGRWLMEHRVERCVVGEETGADGYRHWQMRMVFKKPLEEGQVRALIPEGHWTATQVRDFEYCEKEGNFWRSWEGALRRFQTLELYPWQNELLQRLQQQDDRHVTVLVDRRGNTGKTTLAKVITARHMGAYCPKMSEARDYMAWALAHQTAKIMVLDIPRASDVKKDRELWEAVEQMKTGYLWDKRHHWQEAWIDPPAILVITNAYPDRDLLSWDRWDTGTLEQGAILGNTCNIIHWDLKHPNGGA